MGGKSKGRTNPNGGAKTGRTGAEFNNRSRFRAVPRLSEYYTLRYTRFSVNYYLGGGDLGISLLRARPSYFLCNFPFFFSFFFGPSNLGDCHPSKPPPVHLLAFSPYTRSHDSLLQRSAPSRLTSYPRDLQKSGLDHVFPGQLQ